MSKDPVVGVRRDDVISHYCSRCQADIYVLAIHWPVGKPCETQFRCRQCVTIEAQQTFKDYDDGQPSH